MAAPPSPCIPSMAKPNSEEIREEEKKKIIERYKQIVSTLPKEKGWVGDHLYKYQGFWYHSMFGLEGTMAAQDHFRARPTDLVLATNPKCGTTWLKALTLAIMSRNKFKNSSNMSNNSSTHPLLTSNPHALIPNLEFKLFGLNPLVNAELETLPSPRVFATHIPYTSLPESVIHSGCRLVYICRNPKDVLVSRWIFSNKLRGEGNPQKSLEEAFDYFCKGVSPFGPYWDHVLGYYKGSLEHPTKVLFLKYEDMKNDILVNVKRLAMFLGYPFTLEEEEQGVVNDIIELCSFENLSNLEVNKNGIHHGNLKNDFFFRKGEVGDSVNHLTTKMIECLDQITEQKFQGFDLSF